MGRFERIHEEKIMTASEVAVFLLKSCRTLSQFSSYVFGSALAGIGTDIDILVVGPRGAVLSKLKKEIRNASEKLPLHVLYMLPSEAQETDFVTKANCIPLSQLARHSQT